MDKTLFLPSMIEAFNLCRRSYFSSMKSFGGKHEHSKEAANSQGLSLLKKFVKRGIAQINRGKVSNSNHVQTFSGEHWPLDEMEKQNFNEDQTTRLFLYSYKMLMSYVKNPYRPPGAHVVCVGQKLRVKVPGAKVYLEDTFDLVLWYPESRTAEIVDFRLRPSNIANLHSAGSYMLARQFLAEKLSSRLPFQKLVMTTCLLGQNSMQVESISVNQDALEQEGAWSSIVQNLVEMKSPQFSGSGDLSSIPPCSRTSCIYCSENANRDETDNNSQGLCLSA